MTTAAGARTEYHYAPDGTRLMNVENEGSANETTTITIGAIEIRNYQPGGYHTAADVLTYPHANVRPVPFVCLMSHSLVVTMSHKHSLIKSPYLDP